MAKNDEQSARRAWLEAGLQVLRSEGDRGLTIDAMCGRMGKTKGAFYHHFAGRADFVVQLLEHWELVFTDGIIEALEPLDDPRRRLRALAARTVREVDLRLERTIRFWSDREPAAREVLERVDRAREQYLCDQFAATMDDPARARAAARTHLAFLVGTQVLYQDLAPDAVREMSIFVDFLGLDCPPESKEKP